MSQLSDIISQVNGLTGFNLPTSSNVIISQSANPVGSGSVNQIVDYINSLTGYNIPYTDVQIVSGSNVAGPVIVYTPYAAGGTIPTTGITPGQIIKAEHVLRVINALNGVNLNNIIISGQGNPSATPVENTILQIHGTTDLPWAFGIYNDTYSSTQSVLAGFVYNDGRAAIGTEVDTPLEIYTNATYNAPTLTISSSGVTINNTLTVNGGITASLQGTASYALNGSSTGSLLTTASAAGSTITFTKGDGSTFPVTVAAGTGAPGGADTQIQFNSGGLFEGSPVLTYDYTNQVLNAPATYINGPGIITNSSYTQGDIYQSFEPGGTFYMKTGLVRAVVGNGSNEELFAFNSANYYALFFDYNLYYSISSGGSPIAPRAGTIKAVLPTYSTISNSSVIPFTEAIVNCNEYLMTTTTVDNVYFTLTMYSGTLKCTLYNTNNDGSYYVTVRGQYRLMNTT